MGQKASRDADEAPRAQEAQLAQECEEEAPRPRQSIRERCYQIQTNGATTWAATEPPPPPPPRPVREIYARYLAGGPFERFWYSDDMGLAERRRITGLEEDPKPSISRLHVGYRVQDYEQRGVVEVTRSTTLGALSQMRLWSQRSCESFINSATATAASVTIDELGDYSDPETGLEHYLEGCSDEEKMAMRVAVFRGLTLIFVLLEKPELHQIILQRGREASDRLPALFASLPQRLAAARAKMSAKPAAKASKKTKKHPSRR